MSGTVELDHQIVNHSGQVLYDLLPVLLYTDCGAVTRGMSVHAADDLG